MWMSSSPFPFLPSLNAKTFWPQRSFPLSLSVPLPHCPFSCFALSKVKSATPVFFVWPVVTDTYSNAAGSVTSVDLILSPQNRREKKEREQAWKGGKVAFTSQSVSLKNKNKRNLSATF